jgi:hypothetical protein
VCDYIECFGFFGAPITNWLEIKDPFHWTSNFSPYFSTLGIKTKLAAQGKFYLIISDSFIEVKNMKVNSLPTEKYSPSWRDDLLRASKATEVEIGECKWYISLYTETSNKHD